MVCQVKITLYGPPNITLEIIFLKFLRNFLIKIILCVLGSKNLEQLANREYKLVKI